MSKQKKTLKVKFLKRFMFQGMERKPDQTKKEPAEYALADALWMIHNGLAEEAKEKVVSA